MMPLRDIITSIHTLPERTRRLAAGASIGIAGICTAFILHAHVTAQLANTIAVGEPSPEQMNLAPSTENTPTPAQGIAESLASLKKLIPRTQSETSDPGLAKKTKKIIDKEFAAFARGFSMLWNYLDVK